MSFNANNPAASYSQWSNDALIARVMELEAQLQNQNREGLAVHTKTPELSRSDSTSTKKKRKPESKRAFDPSRYNTRPIALKIAYLGQNYNGFEHHANNSTPLPTIEETIWKALVKTKLIFNNADEPVNWNGCEYSKCGRTDKGVSAFGQVIGLKVRSSRPKAKSNQLNDEGAEGDDLFKQHVVEEFDDIHDELPYPHLLNRVLPPDIRVLAWCPSPSDDFSARFSCRQRRYRYFFTQPASCPMGAAANTVNEWRVNGDGWLNIDAMDVAAKKFEGLHDFRNFCKQDPARQISNFERRIHHAEIVRLPSKPLGLSLPGAENFSQSSRPEIEPSMYSFDVSGSAFLWHQVRHLVAVLFLIGQGYEKPDLVDTLLDVRKTPEKPVYDMADDRPLVLWDCIFPADETELMEDSLHWVYPGHQNPTEDRFQLTGTFGEGRYGPNSITEILWDGWHARKIDETLAGELLTIACSRPESAQMSNALSSSSVEPLRTARLFTGRGSLQSKGQYIPVLKRSKVEAPEVLNARWLENNPEKARKRRLSAATSNQDMDTED